MIKETSKVYQLMKNWRSESAICRPPLAVAWRSTGVNNLLVDGLQFVVCYMSICICVSWNYDVISKIRLRQSVRIYLLEEQSWQFHTGPTWNDGSALCVYERRSVHQQVQQWVTIWDQFLIRKRRKCRKIVTVATVVNSCYASYQGWVRGQHGRGQG